MRGYWYAGILPPDELAPGNSMIMPPHLVDDIQQVMKQVGCEVRITSVVPIDHAIYGETVFRATFDREIGPLGSTAIVKRRREAGTWRSEKDSSRTRSPHSGF